MVVVDCLRCALLSFVAVACHVAHYAAMTASAGKLGLTGSEVMLFAFPLSPFSAGIVSRSVIRVLPRRALAFSFAFTFALVAPPSSICTCLKVDLAKLLAFSSGVIAIGVESTFCCVSAHTVLGMLLACL